MSSNQNSFSKDFFEFVKAIGECRTKQEEDRVIVQEMQNLKTGMGAKDVQMKKMREYLIRMMYVEMLGHDASFGHIQGVKLISSRNLLEKRIGYLALESTIHKDHEFMLLLVNGMQTDLRSDNFLEVSMALGAISKLVNVDIIPAILPLLINLLEHSQALIRKKTLICLLRCYQLDSLCITEYIDSVRKALCDPDPCVMGAALILIQALAKANPVPYKDMVSSLVSILKQIIEHRLPREYDYHRLPAPWIQMDLLKILAILGEDDKKNSMLMYQILADVIRRAAIGTNIGYAIVYECVRTVTTIYPNPQLLDAAAQAVSHFLTSPNHNLKYLGVTALALIVKVDSKHAVEHQMVVMDCLEDPDETLRHRTLDLLCAMTNPENVVAIVGKLLHHLKIAYEPFMRETLVTYISNLAETHANDIEWYLNTMSSVMELGGDYTPESLCQNVLRLLSQSSDIAGVDMTAVRQRAVDNYIELLLARKSLPDVMMKNIAWVIGEYGYHSSILSIDKLICLLAGATNRQYGNNTNVRYWLLSAIQSLISRLPTDFPVPDVIIATISSCQNARDLVLQQKAHELAVFINSRAFLVHVQPQDQAGMELCVDEKLSFLRDFVNNAIQAGAREYSHPSKSINSKVDKKTLRFTAYEKPEAPVLRTIMPVDDVVSNVSSAVAGESVTSHVDAAPIPTDDGTTSIRLKGGARKWGPKGFNAEKPKPAPTPVVEEAVSSNDYSGMGSSASLTNSDTQFEPKTSSNNTASFTAKPSAFVAKPRSNAASMSLFAGVGGARGPTQASAPAQASGPRRFVAKPSANTSLFTKKTSAPVAAPVAAPVTTPAPAPTPAPANSNTAGLDLLFGDVVSPSNSSQANTVASPSGTDMLGDFFTSPTNSTSTANSSSGIDLFSAMGNSNTQAASHSGHNDNAMDLLSTFGDLSLSSSSNTNTSTSNEDLFGLSFDDTPKSTLPNTLSTLSSLANSDFTQAPVTTISRQTNDFLIDTRSTSTQTQTHIAYTLTNTSSSPVNVDTFQVNFPLTIANTTAFAVVDGKKCDTQSNGNGLHKISTSLKPLSTVSICLKITHVYVTAFNLSNNSTPPVAITLLANGANTPVSQQVPFQVLVRPLEIITKKYAEFWKTLSTAGEVKPVLFPLSGASNDKVAAVLKSIGIHPVQNIKQETIAAGQLIGGESQVLLHVKIIEGGLTVHARSKNVDISNAAIKAFKSMW